MIDDKKITDMFREKGLRVTPQRLVTYRTLWDLRHPSAEEVIEEVRNRIPAITVATVYNTLECLVEAGLVAKVFSPDNKMYFDADTHPHQHLHDSTNHRIIDVYDEDLHTIIIEHLKKNKQLHNYTVQEVKLHLVGYQNQI